jgi:hypothetical protein
MQARDEWIGWSDEQRRQNLQAVINNGRFLILPWVQVKGLASKILALSAKQMPRDWEIRFGYRPLLLETLVDAARFRGPATGLPTGFMLGKPPGVVAWTGRTQPTGRSKISVSTRWCAMRENGSVRVNIEGSSRCRQKDRSAAGNLSGHPAGHEPAHLAPSAGARRYDFGRSCTT